MPTTRRTVLVAALFAAVVPAQTTWIVAAGGGGQFTAIGPAYDAAAPGDTILVRPGSYLGFDRAAKGLRILGDGAGVVVTSPIRLNGIAMPAGQHLHLAGFLVDARSNATLGNSFMAGGLALEDCPSFALSEIEVLAPHGNALGLGLSEGGVGISISRSTGVLSGVTTGGGDGATGSGYGFQGGVGCWIGDSRVAVSRCTFRAGDTGPGGLGTTSTAPSCVCRAQALVALDECTMTPGQPLGGALAVLQARVLLASHTNTITGDVWVSNIAGPGGSLEFDGPVTAAAWSAPLTPRAQPGLVGPDTVIPGGTIVWTVRGGANRVALAVASLGIQPFSYSSLLDTPLFTATLPSSVYLGVVTIGSGGTATLSFPVPNLPWLRNEHVAMQVVGWIGQPTWKASGVALTRIR